MGGASSKAAEMAAIGQRKRAERDAKHASFKPPVLNADLTQRILGASACELIELMRTRELTAVQVVGCYVQRCHSIAFAIGGTWFLVQGVLMMCTIPLLLICAAITEENYTAALELARLSDEKRARGDAVGPLEGLIHFFFPTVCISATRQCPFSLNTLYRASHQRKRPL